MQVVVKYKFVFSIPLCVLALLVCIAGGALDARAADATKTITMFVPDLDWPPYLITDPEYQDEGALVEIFKAVVKPMGYRVLAKQLPDKRGWELLRSGQIDVHMKAKEWVENPDDYLWSEPFLLSEDVLVFPASSSASFATEVSLYGKTVVAIEGFIYPGMEPLFDDGKVLRVDSTSPYTMLELLARGRVDAALLNRAETQWLFRTRPDLRPKRFRIDEVPCASACYRYVFTKDDKWLPFIKEFNIRLETMKKNGTIKAILDQYR